ncbi:MAG: undecaprenyl-diphosphate phosphatase [Pseudomonadota bacterium]
MPLIQLIVLAVIQGITEFLPISSSAHLVLAPLAVDGWSDQGPLIDIAAHVGSLGAVLLYFRSETAMLVRGGIDAITFKDTSDRRLFLVLAVATIPIVALAAVLVPTGVIDAMRSPYVIGWASIGFGVLLWHGDRRRSDRAPAADAIAQVGWAPALAVGAAQMLALIPGASRSGVTMTAARYLGWSRREAARFSMLLAIPTILVLGAVAGLKLVNDGAEATTQAALVVAGLSFLAAYASIAVLMRMTRSMSFTPFVIYRLIFGALILFYAERLAAGG